MKRRILQYGAAGLLFVLPLAAQQAGQTQSQGQTQQQPQGQGPHPKSQKEVEALQKVQTAAQSGDAKAEIAAINNVLENFADTEYKSMLMAMAMDAAQRSGDSAQTVVWGERIIQSDPNDYSARVLLAESIAAHTRENDLDKDQSLKKAEDYANKALELIPNASTPPQGIPPDRFPEYKKQMTSEAHDALGQVAELRKNYPDAVKQYQQALDAQPTNTVAEARMAKTYVENKQYDEAISAADKVLADGSAPQPVKTFAQQQKDLATKQKASAPK